MTHQNPGLLSIALALVLATGCERAPELARTAEAQSPSAAAAAPSEDAEAGHGVRQGAAEHGGLDLPPDSEAESREDARGRDDAASGGAAQDDAQVDGPAVAPAPVEADDPGAATPDTLDRRRFDPRREFPDARFPRPEHVRGVYANAWAGGSNRRMSALLDLARDTEVNSIVIDIKDATGYISHRTEVELAHQIGATEEVRIPDLPGLLDRLEAEGVYPIARIVIVKDPILTAFRPEYAIQDTAGGVWVDNKGISWLNLYYEPVWKYHVDLAREVAEMGFPEIQWDYVRFPDAPQADLDRAVYTGAEGRPRSQAIRGFLQYARQQLADLPVRSTADVFGVTTTYRRDVGIGQIWEEFIDVVDVALPMVYPSHYYPGSFGYSEPNGRPYEVVRQALRDAERRSATVEGAGLTRPWLQDFTLGQPIYAGAEVRAQIQATYDAGVQEWILWNPGSRYTASALEPAGGFEHEPLMRVAGVLAPVSRRHVVIDSIAALPPEPRAVVGENRDEEVEPEVDSLRIEPVPADTIGR